MFFFYFWVGTLRPGCWFSPNKVCRRSDDRALSLRSLSPVNKCNLYVTFPKFAYQANRREENLPERIYIAAEAAPIRGEGGLRNIDATSFHFHLHFSYHLCYSPRTYSISYVYVINSGFTSTHLVISTVASPLSKKKLAIYRGTRVIHNSYLWRKQIFYQSHTTLFPPCGKSLDLLRISLIIFLQLLWQQTFHPNMYSLRACLFFYTRYNALDIILIKTMASSSSL